MSTSVHRYVNVCENIRIHAIPKVGSTSIGRACKPARLSSEYPHDGDGQGRRVMFVRHPLDRLVSVWSYFIAPMAAAPNQDHMLDLGYTQGQSFEDFLSVVLEQADNNVHTKKQAAFAGPFPIELYRLEDMGEVWPTIRASNPKIGGIQHTNESQHDGWYDYYDRAMREAAMDYYAGDMWLYEKAKR